MDSKGITKAPETLSPEDVWNEVRKFIDGTVPFNHNKNFSEVNKTALLLLQNVPATRDAVFEYFSNIFHAAVLKYVRQIETNHTGSISEESIVAEIHSVLSNFINENPKAWAPIISSWSLELLGTISTENYKRGNLRNNSGINDVMQQWMSCRATRTLIEITSQCLLCLMHADTESCIKALLETSVVHSPHFDWVVTHVGSCFPNTVITRVLSCGLKDFCAMGYEHNIKNSKLNSVIGILGHLAASHSHDIRKAILDLFKWSLNENVNDDNEVLAQKLATVPFLINLASLSNTLLKAVTTDFLQVLTPEIIPQLALFATEWCKYFDNQQETLIDLVAQLALGCEQGALQIINILLDNSLNTSNVGYHSVNAAQSVKSVCRQILELILKEIDLLIRTQDNQTANIALLNSLKNELPAITPLLLNSNPLRVQTAVRLLSLLGTLSTNVLISAATYMLQNAQTNFHLAALVRLISDNVVLFSAKKIDADNALLIQDFFTQVVEKSIRDIQFVDAVNERDVRRLFKNLTILLKWENSEKVSYLRFKFVTYSIRYNYQHIATLLQKTDDTDLAYEIAITLDSLGPPNDEQYLHNVELALKLTRAIIHFFFMCVAQDDIIKKEKGVKIVCRYLRGLTYHSPCARNLAIRELLEQSIFNDHAKYFGAKEKFQQKYEEPLILNQNHKQGTSVMLAQRHSSVFHAGVIGNGPRKLPPENQIDKECIMLNRMLLMDAIKACCSVKERGQYIINSDFLTMVSLLLVELISSDVMYNGLPWPDEDFTKVTVERDLQIRRSFKDVPLLWTLLELTAWYRPALAYCSVLLRAIAATVMANWNIAEGILLTNVMALGQLLPPPIASIRDILSVLESHQVNTVMRECVWAYMHENVPSPALFTRTEEANVAWRDTDTSAPSVRFTETLRLLLLANIHSQGSLYCTIFYDPKK